MLQAPREWQQPFYDAEIDGQKRRLTRLKERQRHRQELLHGKPKAAAAKVVVDRPAAGLRAQVAAVLAGGALRPPCTAGDVFRELGREGGGEVRREEVEAVLRDLAAGPRSAAQLRDEGGGEGAGRLLTLAAVDADKLQRPPSPV